MNALDCRHRLKQFKQLTCDTQYDQLHNYVIVAVAPSFKRLKTEDGNIMKNV